MTYFGTAHQSSFSQTSSTRRRLRRGWATSVPRRVSRTRHRSMRAAMRDNGGTPVDGKVLGDGVMGDVCLGAGSYCKPR